MPSNWHNSEPKSYLGVHCNKCGSPILFAIDRSDGNPEQVSFARLVLTCSQDECRHRADYSSATASQFRR